MFLGSASAAVFVLPRPPCSPAAAPLPPSPLLLPTLPFFLLLFLPPLPFLLSPPEFWIYGGATPGAGVVAAGLRNLRGLGDRRGPGLCGSRRPWPAADAVPRLACAAAVAYRPTRPRLSARCYRRLSSLPSRVVRLGLPLFLLDHPRPWRRRWLRGRCRSVPLTHVKANTLEQLFL